MIGHGSREKAEDRLEGIAGDLEHLAARLRMVGGFTPDGAGGGQEQLPFKARAIRLFRERRDRDRAFAATGLVSGEPGWDMLLLLYTHQAIGRRTFVTDAAIAGGGASTTGLRHLVLLENDGLVLREADVSDRRRTMVRLSDHGVTLMRLYLEGVSGPD